MLCIQATFSSKRKTKQKFRSGFSHDHSSPTLHTNPTFGLYASLLPLHLEPSVCMMRPLKPHGSSYREEHCRLEPAHETPE